MTTRREVPLTGDTFAWVHSELAEIKSRLAVVQQAAEQSRSLATDAAEVSHQTRSALSIFDGQDMAIAHLQDDLRSQREHVARSQDDINSLRQSREEIERRLLADSERVRQDKNDLGRRFGELERVVEATQLRFEPLEDHGRRHLEVLAQLAMRVEAIEAAHNETVTLQSRSQTQVSRIDQELQRISGTLPALQREDDVQRERANSALEALRRLESVIEGLRQETNKISRLDDRLELVQAERTRHNERLIEVTAELHSVDVRLNTHDERAAMIEARIVGYMDELKSIKERMRADRETIANYLEGIKDIEAEMRKRQISAIEKEMRDIRGRALDFAEE